MAMLVLLVPASETDPSLQPAAVSELARLGVTDIDLVRDQQTVGLVLAGWAFDPSRSADAVFAVVGCRRSRARERSSRCCTSPSRPSRFRDLGERPEMNRGGERMRPRWNLGSCSA